LPQAKAEAVDPRVLAHFEFVLKERGFSRAVTLDFSFRL
jgi:hypothetical protein